jgi:hypothetical protein
MGKIPYCGYDPSSTKHPGPDLMDEAVLRDQRLKALEDDNRRLKAAVRSLEGALRVAPNRLLSMSVSAPARRGMNSRRRMGSFPASQEGCGNTTRPLPKSVTKVTQCA